MTYDLEDVNKYATGVGFEDVILWDYKSNTPSIIFNQARKLGLLLHIWTFKDDVLFFNSTTNIVNVF